MKNTKFVAIMAIAIFALSLSACTKQNNKPAGSAAPNVPNSAVDSAAAPTISYTLEDVKMHASRSDCWTAISGNVYDLTSYIASGQHKPVIIDGCGIDSTNMFNNIDKHSGSKAQNMLPGMIIGTLSN